MKTTSTRDKAKLPSVSSSVLSKAGNRASQVGFSDSNTTAVGLSETDSAGFSPSSPSWFPLGGFHASVIFCIVFSRPLVTDPWPRFRSDFTLPLMLSVYIGTSPARLATWAVMSHTPPPSTAAASMTTKITEGNRLRPRR